jgi:hypothetical protein
MALLLLAQLRFRFVAFDGAIVATRVSLLPAARLVAILFKATPVTATLLDGSNGVTVTAQVAVCPPFRVVTVMVAVPTATAATSPLTLTVAMALLLLAQLRFRFVAFDGAIVATRVSLPPSYKLSVALPSVTPVTRIALGSAAATVTAQVSVLPPSAVVTVMVAVPSPTALTVAITPSPLTVATEALLVDQLTALFVASAGATVAVSCTTSPTSKSGSVVLFRETLMTATSLPVPVGLRQAAKIRPMARPQATSVL